MTKRALFWFSLLILFVALASVVQAHPDGPPSGPGNALIYVPLLTQGDLARFERTGLPVYARLRGRDEEYVLAGAGLTGDVQALDVLAAAGFSACVLDVDTAGASYYLAYSMPGQPRLDWGSYGRVLLDDGVQVLLRASPQDAERLAGAGVELRALAFEPKPLRPASPTGVFPAVVTPDPWVQSMINQVESTAVYSYTGDLSGEWPVEIGGVPHTIITRHTYSGYPLQQATQFVGAHLADLGLDVEYHVWNTSYPPNVIGELTGTLYPDEIVIICGHLDDMPPGLVAPGADDNASGSVAVLVAADILTQYQWAYTLRFALWTGEEQGLLGSAAYAQRAYNDGENIVGVLNLDMIAWNSLGSNPDIDLHARSSIPSTLGLADLFADVVDAYDLNLVPQIVSNGTGASDHASFWAYGYTAILGIEDFGDFNPYYHTTDDLLATLDLGYFTDFVKASVGTFAHMGSPLGDVGHLTGTVSNRETGAPVAGAAVEAALNQYQTWATTTGAGGDYQLAVLSGTYTVTVAAPGYMSAITTGITVETDQTSTLDIGLAVTPTYVISGRVRDAFTGLPLLATVSLPGSPITPTQTDPATGLYVLTATVPSGSYVLRAEAAHYLTQDRLIALDGDRVEGFDLGPCCLLVVDDDGGMSLETYYTGALDRLGYFYDTTATPPDLEALVRYQGVIWLTGDQSSDTLTAADQANLTAYLDGRGRLFLSGQDIGYDVGNTSFYADYLHAAFDSNDAEADTLSGLDFLAGLDITISGGDGANNQLWPSDVEPFNGGVAVYDYPAPQLYGGVAYSGMHQTVYFSFGYEAINNQADRDAVMSATLAYLGVCDAATAPRAGFDSSSPDEPGATTAFTNTTQGSPWITYTWDFGDETARSHAVHPTHPYAQSGVYTVVLTATSRYGRSVYADAVRVGDVCTPVSGADFVYSPLEPLVGETVTFIATADEGTAAPPITYTWDFGGGVTSTVHVDTITHTFPITTTVRTYTVTLTIANTCPSQETVKKPIIVQVGITVYLPLVVRDY